MTEPLVDRSAMKAKSERAAKRFTPLDPKTVTPRQTRRQVSSIEAIHHDAPEATKAKGRTWYPKAHDIAGQVGRRVGGGSSTGAGIVAALSPSMDWDDNIGAAHQFPNLPDHLVDAMSHHASAQAQLGREIAKHEKLVGKGNAPAHLYAAHAAAKDAHMSARSVLRGTPLDKQSTDNLVKAQRIRAGESPTQVLPARVKTGNFYRNVNDPSDREPVTIDTHAHDIAVGVKLPFKQDRGLSAVGRYDHFADAYRTASRRLGDATPGETQAITWTHWRDRYGQNRAAKDVDRWRSWTP